MTVNFNVQLKDGTSFLDQFAGETFRVRQSLSSTLPFSLAFICRRLFPNLPTTDLIPACSKLW